MNQEYLRKLNNIVQVGTVTETKCDDGLALARVNILGRVTDFLPIVMISNSFIKVWMPVQVNEQVLVISPFGEANSGFIIPSIYHKANKEPKGSTSKNAIIQIGNVRFECNGESIKIDAKNFKLDIGNVSFECNEESIKIDAKNFKLDREGNLTITGRITDSLGDLTGHEHSVERHSIAVKRG